MKNFFHRWVLDRGDRVAKFLEGGYEFIKQTSDGTYVGESTVEQSSGLDSRVSRSAGNGGLRLFLMRIPMNWYMEDQEAKEREIQELEETMRPRKGVKGGEKPDYGSITLTRKTVEQSIKDQDI